MTSQKTQEKTNIQKVLDVIQPFWIGGFSGMVATCVIQPVDMIKTVIQLKSQSQGNVVSTHGRQQIKANFFTAFSDINKTEGLKGFYRGIDSALARQLFYTTARMGIYKTASEKILAKNKQEGLNTLSFFQKAFCASLAGFLGSLIGNPADLALVRMQADNQLPLAERRNYKNVIDAFSRIRKQEGVAALWRGATPTVVRAVALNLAMLSSYDQVKERLQKYFRSKQTLEIRVMASLVAGFLSSFCSLPFDNAKTKLQKMKKSTDGTYPYKNIFDALKQTLIKEGPTKLWVGYPTFYLRIAPHASITLILQDIITDIVKRRRAAY